jgi:hypothetical protein
MKNTKKIKTFAWVLAIFAVCAYIPAKADSTNIALVKPQIRSLQTETMHDREEISFEDTVSSDTDSKDKEVELTDAQKSAIKQAGDLAKSGKYEEAQKVLQIADLPIKDSKNDKVTKKAEFAKQAIKKADELNKTGQKDAAKEVLKNAGIPEAVVVQIQSETLLSQTPEKKSFLRKVVNFFKGR